jgi:hypothetical protein
MSPAVNVEQPVQARRQRACRPHERCVQRSPLYITCWGTCCWVEHRRGGALWIEQASRGVGNAYGCGGSEYCCGVSTLARRCGVSVALCGWRGVGCHIVWHAQCVHGLRGFCMMMQTHTMRQRTLLSTPTCILVPTVTTTSGQAGRCQVPAHKLRDKILRDKCFLPWSGVCFIPYLPLS